MYAYPPQIKENNTAGSRRATGELPAKDESTTRVFLADAKTEERSALRLMLQDLQMVVVGEAVDWMTVLAKAPISNLDMLLADMDLLPEDTTAALSELRLACSHSIAILLVGRLDGSHAVTVSTGADGYISTGDSPEHVAEHLVSASRKKNK